LAFIAQNIWLILAILGLVTIGGAWALLSTGYIHRISDWFKPGSDRYMQGKIFCGDKQIRDRKLKVGKYCLLDMKKHRAFYTASELLLSTPLGSLPFYALTERDARPIDFHGKLTKADWEAKPSAQRVFIDTTADIRSESSKEAASNFMAQSLSIIAICAAIVVVIFGAIVFYQSRLGGA
jgi:hypothetical protein